MVRTNFAKLTVALLIVSTLSGCKNTPASPPAIGTEGVSTYEQIQLAVKKLNKDPTAQEIADTLTAISAVKVPDADRSRVSQLEVGLLTHLRDKVKSDVSALHQRALKSPSYADGYTSAREAASVLALYPLSDTPEVVSEAEGLSMSQNEVLRRLELIRRQRYNHWAAGQAEQALKELRENGKDGAEQAITYLCIVEPSLLESSVASLYSYTVTEIMDEFKKDKKASVAKRLTDPSVTRRNLEGF